MLTSDAPRSTGYGSHGDYMFGWKGDALQRAMDSPCYVNCPTLETQSIEEMNKCTVPDVVGEPIDGCECSPPPGGIIIMDLAPC